MGGGGADQTLGYLQYEQSKKTYEAAKDASEVIKETSSETARAQQLRHGITSTFSRSSVGKGGTTTSSATSGSAKKLGS